MKLLYIFFVILVVLAIVLTGGMCISNFMAHRSLSQLSNITEKEYNLRVKKEKDRLSNEIEEKYKGELASFSQIATQLELEKKQVKELVERVKEEETKNKAKKGMKQKK